MFFCVIFNFSCINKLADNNKIYDIFICLLCHLSNNKKLERSVKTQNI